MYNDVDRVLFDEAAIQSRLRTLAETITADYQGKELAVVAILNGSLIFAADLLRHIPLPLTLQCLSVASYHGGTESSGTVTFNQLALPDLSGKHVLILDDILDSGLTLEAVSNRLAEAEKPASVRICVLLQKRKERIPAIAADYVGFEIEDEFVVGYGLDYQQRYRNLPFVGVLRGEAS